MFLRKALPLMLGMLMAGSVFAAESTSTTTTHAAKAPSAKQLAQREKMKTCNAEAKGKTFQKGERKAFMSNCLKGGSSTSTDTKKPATQQEKMKACNAEAKGKTFQPGERKAFMSNCLKN